jgi:hypothetical protein
MCQELVKVLMLRPKGWEPVQHCCLMYNFHPLATASITVCIVPFSGGAGGGAPALLPGDGGPPE